MSSSILLAADLGPYNDQIIVQASLFAQQQQGDLSILHVVDPEKAAAGMVVGSYLSTQLDHYSAFADLELLTSSVSCQIESAVLDLACSASDVDVRIGDVGPTIVAQALASKADLIVMGQRISDGGTTLDYVLSEAKVPVLVLPITTDKIQ